MTARLRASGQIAGPVVSALLLRAVAAPHGLALALQAGAIALFASGAWLWRAAGASVIPHPRRVPMPADSTATALRQGSADAVARAHAAARARGHDRRTQRAAAQALIDGPRKGVYGPFLPLLRSPQLLDRVARLGEHLRFGGTLDARVRELATCARGAPRGQPVRMADARAAGGAGRRRRAGDRGLAPGRPADAAGRRRSRRP